MTVADLAQCDVIANVAIEPEGNATLLEMFNPAFDNVLLQLKARNAID